MGTDGQGRHNYAARSRSTSRVVRKKASGDHPPYLPYSTFRRAIEALSYRSVSKTVTPRVALGFSDAQYSALISALRFLNLVGRDREVGSAATTQMRKLLEARRRGRTEYARVLLPILKKAYRPILQKVDLERGTRQDLEVAFMDAGVLPGQMNARSVRFLVRALEECGAIEPRVAQA